MSKILDIIAIPLGYLIRFCYMLTGNYAIALLLFAIAMQVILLPLGIKQQKNMVKQARMRPREAAIRKKYAGREDKVTQQKMNDEIMAMYQEEHFNPMGGCLPLLIQFPILFALFRVVMDPLRYICQLSTEVITLITERLSTVYSITTASQIEMVSKIRDIGVDKFSDIAPSLTAETLPKFTMFGNYLDLSIAPRDDVWSILLLIPILTFVATVLSQKLTKKFSYQPNTDVSNNTSMKILEWSMPLMSVYFCFMYAGAIGVYWIFRNVLSTLQQFLLSRFMPYPVFTEQDFKAAEKAAGTPPPRPKSEKKVRSLHRIDEEDDEPAAAALPEKNDSKGALGSAIASAPLKQENREVKNVPDSKPEPDTDKDSGDYTDLTDGSDAEVADAPKAKNPNESKSNYSKTGKNYKKK